MSDNNDDTLLEEDLGDDIDYDLGNEDEDALLADDYDVAQTTTHRTVYLQEQQDVLGNKDGFRREPEEPLDDVLDLGVTEGDALDDLDSELQETQEPMGGESIRRVQKHHERKPMVHDPKPVVHDPKPIVRDSKPVVRDPKPMVHDPKPVLHDYSHLDSSGLVVQQEQVDVTDASQISQETSFMEGGGDKAGGNPGVSAGVESEEEEDEAEESRGDRFKTERTTIVSLKGSNKSYGNIPDSLDNVCVEDAKQVVVRRDGGWKGRRGRRGGGPCQHFGPGNTFGAHPQQQLPPQQIQIQTQLQQFGGPRFGPGNPGFPRSVRGGMRGGHMYSQPQVNQQPMPPPPPQQQPLPPPPPQQQPQQQPLQQQHQSPHKILINPHFRGAVQPHPEARLIWDTEMAGNPAQLPPQPSQGDGVVAFAPGVQTMDSQYQGIPQGGGYGTQQFQPPPHHQQIESHSLPSPQYDSPSQQGGYYPPEQTYSDPHSIQHWQDNCEPSQQVNAVYTQPSPMGMEANSMPVGHHDSMYHHASHVIAEPGINHGQPGGVMYGGVVPYESVPQQQEMFVEEGNYPPAGLPPQQHYHPQQQPQPPPMSPGGHRLPPPMMMEASMWQCTTDGTTDEGLHHVAVTQPAPTQYHNQGPYRLPGPPGVPGGMKFRQPNHAQFQGGSGYVNQGGRPRGGPRFNVGVRMNVPQQMIRPRRAPGPQIHMVQQQQQQPPPPQQSNRPPKKRPSFDTGAGPSSQFKQNRFDASTKRKKRMPDMSNLHEVQMVDNLPSDVNSQQQYVQPEEEEDEETREYRKKIEQQKREREKFLQRKEERRKLAALEKQKVLNINNKSNGNVDYQAAGDAVHLQFDPPQGNAIATIVNRNTVEPQPVVNHTVVRHVQQQQQQQQQQPPLQQHVPPQQQKIHQQVPQHVPLQNVGNHIQVQQQFHQDMELPQPPSAAPTTVVVRQQVRGGRGRGFRGRGMGRGAMFRHQFHHQYQHQQQFMQRPQLQKQQMQQQMPQPLVVVPVQEAKIVTKVKATATAPGQRIVRAPQPGAAVPALSAAPPRRLVLPQGAGHQLMQVPRQVVPAQQQQQQQQQQQHPPAAKGRTVVLRGAQGGSKPLPQQQTQQTVGGQRIVVASKSAQQQGAPNRQPLNAGGRSVVATKGAAPQQQETGPQQPALPRTKTVLIENLAASTSENQLKTLCQGIGAIESIQMLSKQRRAIIKFVNPNSAATFYKRYQRKIIDLSLITVSLVP